MPQTLQYIRTLLTQVGARISPEPLPLPPAPFIHGELRPADQGSRELEAVPFSFFLASAQEAFLLGEVPQEEGVALPITLLSLGCGVLARTGSGLAPYLKPIHGHVVCMPPQLAALLDIEGYRGVGITILASEAGTPSREGMIRAQLQQLRDMVEDTKESVFLAWHGLAGVAGHAILVEGSLHPTHSVLTTGSWVGVRIASELSPLEERAALGLSAGAASLPFGYESSGGYWFTRLTPDARADAGEGLLRLESAFVDDVHVAAKVMAHTRAVFHDRFPLTPAGSGIPLYPLYRGRAYLATYLTAPSAVMQAL